MQGGEEWPSKSGGVRQPGIKTIEGGCYGGGVQGAKGESRKMDAAVKPKVVQGQKYRGMRGRHPVGVHGHTKACGQSEGSKGKTIPNGTRNPLPPVMR